jgi:hypothetical protein
MEGYAQRHQEICSAVWNLSSQQARDCSPCKATLASSHSFSHLGRYLHALHRGLTSLSWFNYHFGGYRLFLQILSFSPSFSPVYSNGRPLILVQHIQTSWLPQTIFSNLGPIFTSTFWCELFHLQGISLAFISAYHRQFDGQTESLNKCFETYLWCYTGSKPKDWSR